MTDVKELERRPMSSWTKEELEDYTHLTGQCGCPYACADVDGMQMRIDRLEATLATTIEALEMMAIVYLSKQGVNHGKAESVILDARKVLSNDPTV